MAVLFPDRLESNNPREYGIVTANQVSGHKSVQSFDLLLKVPDAILSSSKTNANDDAIGQLWYVSSEKLYYQLIDWNARHTATGWKKAGRNIIDKPGLPIYESVDDVIDDDKLPDSYLVATGATPAFTEDEDKAMMLRAIKTLSDEVARMKLAFTDHMDCGNFSNNKMTDVANAEGTTPTEPIWASEDGTPKDPDELGERVPRTEPSHPKFLKVAHLTIKAGLWKDFKEISRVLLPYEMVWITDKDKCRLYIKQEDGSMYWINKGSKPDDTPGNTDTPNPSDPILPDMENVEKITFVSPNKTKYRMSITDAGDIKVINERTETAPDESSVMKSGSFQGMSKALYLPQLYINSLFCGGIDVEHPSKWQYCSHNFVELSNLTNEDISLNGMSLQYSINGTTWEVLPLEGIIKKGSTFLIRGAACSYMEANTTKIKVKTYDMEWRTANGKLIQFSNIKCKFLLTYGVKPCEVANPYVQDNTATEKAYCTLGYIDMVGLQKPAASTVESIDGFENLVFSDLVPDNRLYVKYFAMDNVKQANKTIGKRKNSTDWTYVQLDKEVQPNIEAYTPKASFEGKTIFYNKTNLDESKPNMVTVTFGRNAHTTRCFNWVSVGYYDEYLRYRKAGTSNWKTIESFKVGDDRQKFTSKYYNRIRVRATNGVCYTVHKMIINDLTPGTYEYQCGRDGHWSDINKYKVTAETTGSFSFVQHSDQQAFNWYEYEVWRKAAEFIRKEENPLFTINTGDMTQNGNRINEWIDYYNAGSSLFDGHDRAGMQEFAGVEQMNITGNNDLCPEDYEELGNGSDISKISSINFLFFYTYEMDEENPPIITHKGSDYYIPSLYSFDYNNVHFVMVNSEIPNDAQDLLFGGADVYDFVKGWMTRDIDKSTKKWKIVAMHEMPFTIITADKIKSFLDNNKEARGGSRINTDVKSGDTYWVSKLMEEKGIRLCIGGHKHTYSVSYPLIDTVEDGQKLTMQPTIQTKDPAFESQLSDEDKKICKVQVVSKITAPTYAMCQATGAKMASNKELPAERIPWLRNYFPSSLDGSGVRKPNPGQQYPTYIKWTVEENRIVGDVVKIDNIMTKGKFNINKQNTKPLAKLNGNGSSNSQIIIEF